MNDKYEKTIIAIMGKTSSGKDTIANYIKKKYNIPVICSYTTRTMRAGEQDGLEHYFISKEQMTHIMETEHILGYTKNEKTGIEYCATLESMKNNIAIYIINPNGLQWLEERNPGIKLIKIYVYLEEEIIKKRALSRGDSEKSINIRLDSERDEFDTYYKQVITGNETDVNVVSTNSDIVFKDIDEIMHNFFYQLFKQLHMKNKGVVIINQKIEDLICTEIQSYMSNKKHYEGELGVFDYDKCEFEIKYMSTGYEYLHYHGAGSSVDLPEGCINTRYMFWGCSLSKGFTLGENFNTSKVTDMRAMFCDCKLPESFTLGKYFNTSNVINMSGMFKDCKLPKNFTLGKYFNTSNVINMSGMFKNCKLPKNFTLGEKFDTSQVTDMSYMFSNCEMSEGFSLGKYFNTSNVINMHSMFSYCKVPKGFILEGKFVIGKATDTRYMFTHCEMSKDFILGYKQISITNNEKEAIDIVLEMINKKIDILIKKIPEIPETTEKIKKLENAKVCLLDLKCLDL